MNSNALFLPEDYIAPRSNKGYAKLMNGVNKIRILSSPVIGWEDWFDNRPVRYPMNEKPSAWNDATKPGRHFWSMVIWNYQEEIIQVLHLTQGSIRKALEGLSKDSDWGAPFFYDIKITREGEGLKTKYTVNPLPHKDVESHIKEAFYAKRCNLDSLFSGEDPFGLCDEYTQGVFVKEDTSCTEKTDNSKTDNSVFKSGVKRVDELGRECDPDEMDAFIGHWSEKYDKNLLLSYIEKRSDHFKVNVRETTYLLMQDQKGFEKEFKRWSEKTKS